MPVFRHLATTLGLTMSLAACMPSRDLRTPAARASPALAPEILRRYAAIKDESFLVAAVDPNDLKPRNVRQIVDDPTQERPGTLVVDPYRRFLYLVMEGGRAMRYGVGVGVGKAGFEFAGEATVARKAIWPRWTPTPDMIRREPERNARWAGGMAGGERNPLGARALYLFKDGKDTLYRIHGTTEPWSVGEAVSSGCIRMLNQDVIDLFGRVPTGARVVVLGFGADADPSKKPAAREVVGGPEAASAPIRGMRRIADWAEAEPDGTDP